MKNNIMDDSAESNTHAKGSSAGMGSSAGTGSAGASAGAGANAGNPKTSPKEYSSEELGDKLTEIFEESDYKPKPQRYVSEEEKLDSELVNAKNEAQANFEALQRERASFLNYKKRAEQEKSKAKELGVKLVLESMLSALDDIDRAGDELTGPMRKIADKIKGVFESYGVTQFGEVGDEFDHLIHDALMNKESDDAVKQTVETVVEKGYKMGDAVIRPAKVVVVSPKEEQK
jgi:molecular chaperone GrpE